MAFTERAADSARRGVTARDVMASGVATTLGVMAPGPPAPPGPPQPPRPRGWFRRGLRRALREPFTRRTWRECLYAGLSLLVAIPLFAFTAVAVTVGLALSVSFAGLPLLALALQAARRLGAFCRRLANRALGPRAESQRLIRLKQDRPIEEPPPFRAQPGFVGWIRSSLTDSVSWRACAYLLLKLPIALLAGSGVIYIVAWGVGYSTFPVWWELIHQLAAHGDAVQVPGWLAWWTPNPVLVAQAVPSLAVSFALIPAGLCALLWTPWMIGGCNDLDRRTAARLLGPPLTQRVRDLEQTRASAVDDSAVRLRRIERDLHDGAQAQMVAVAMKLGLAREKLGGEVSGTAERAAGRTTEIDLARALELVDAAHRSAKEAIMELRDLARGIHPPVLDHGLGTALATLGARSGLPVEVVADLPERPSAAIETIAYFCAAELLANVAKHSGARHATVEAVHVPGLLRVRVSDDGDGGARARDGSGLAGLAERLRTVDGTLQISSPRGGPTVITVEMPSHA
ncbi:MAG TPA: sensor domain-containing protein [Trebonia sp.]|nr:sensor domain-containing protein [Trebonia sp.]